MSTISTANPPKRRAIASDEALRIARLQGERAYCDLSKYRVSVVLEADSWHVDYQLKDSNLNGGPHFVIDPSDGRIV
jgi:hypothetical protein